MYENFSNIKKVISHINEGVKTLRKSVRKTDQQFEKS